MKFVLERFLSNRACNKEISAEERRARRRFEGCGARFGRCVCCWVDVDEGVSPKGAVLGSARSHTNSSPARGRTEVRSVFRRRPVVCFLRVVVHDRESLEHRVHG